MKRDFKTVNFWTATFELKAIIQQIHEFCH